MKMKATFKPKQGRQIVQALKRAEKECNSKLFQAITEATLEVHAEAVKGVMKRSAGEKQTRYNPKRDVIASKPGDPPNVDMGLFVRSIQFEVDPTEMKGYVGSNDVRASWFEFGTKNMEARPWLGPALQKAKKRIKEIMRKIKIEVE
jgi:HK97 gp10 family phage protein